MLGTAVDVTAVPAAAVVPTDHQAQCCQSKDSIAGPGGTASALPVSPTDQQVQCCQLKDTAAGTVAVGAAAGAALTPEVRVYRRRWLMLALFSLVLALNSVPWTQYTVLEDVVTDYYGVTSGQVEWTGLVYNVTAMVLVLPAAWLLERHGARVSVSIGALGTGLGLCVRIAGCWPNRFWAVIAGQALVGASTSFLTSVPPRLAALWFPAKQVSTAMAVTIVAQTAGVCLGSFLAPLTARVTWTKEENFRGFLLLNVSTGVFGVVLLLAVLILFRKAPPHPPSSSQAAAQVLLHPGEYLKSVRRILKNGSFLLLVVSFNIIVSVYVAVTTLLNRDVANFFPERISETGVLVTLITFSGMVATFAFGMLLDRTKKFKELSVISYFACAASIAVYSTVIATTSMEVLYVAVVIMGAFLSSCFVPAYEWAVELTYPEPEGNPTSLLNWIVQPCCLVGTLAYSHVFSTWGPHAAHGLLVGLTLAGLIAQVCIPRSYRRLEAELAQSRTGLDGTEPRCRDNYTQHEGFDNPAVEPDD